MTTQAILDALRQVDDPDLGKDIVTLGMVRHLSIKDDAVSFTLFLTTPACPMKDVFQRACTNAIVKLVNPKATVNITFDADPKKENAKQTGLAGVKHAIAVYSAKGGVGKSTVAANLAISLSLKGAKVGLLDADIYGPSIPSLFGLYNEKVPSTNVDGKTKMLPIEKYGISVISLGMLVPKEQAIVWRGPMASTAIKQLLFDVLWSDIDYLIIDMPPGTGDIHLTLMQSIKLSGAVVVTTPQAVAVDDTRRSISMLLLDAINIPIIGLVENMSYLPTDQGAKQYLFGKEGGRKLAGEFGILLLGEIPIEEQLGNSQDQGIPFMANGQKTSITSSAFHALTEKVVRTISMREASIPQQHIVERLQ